MNPQEPGEVVDDQETPTDEQQEAAQLKFAMSALSAIKTREQEFDKGWWKQAEDAEKMYTADSNQQEKDVPYNILYSNTEVLLPSLYSATPKPDIRTRFRGMDLKPLPDMVQRFLTVASDPASPGGESFDGAMTECVLSSLVPGMGYVRLRYVEGRNFPLVYEAGHFKTLIWGKASRWAKVPWIAFKYPMKKDMMFKQFNIPPEDGELSYVPSSDSEDSKDDCTVYEYWDKTTKKVYFLCEEWREKQLEVKDDPLGLENFYPTPGLLTLTLRSGKMLPIPLLNYYKNQADELNRVSVRLNRVLAAIRVRGVYNGIMGEDLKNLLSADAEDNTLIAASEAALLAQTGGLDKHIWLMPIEKLIQVAESLYKARENIKQVIYELTGISDIIRGSSVASETATAQDLKNKWGTVRLRRMQAVVANYARDLFRMSVDCGSDHISADQWKLITQMDIPTAQEKQVAQQQLQYMQQQAQAMQAQMSPQAPPQPGMPPQAPQPPQMPPPDPKLLAAAQSPMTVEDMLTKIKSDMSRTFVINIQTSSTIDLDTAQDKSDVTEFMNALGQLLPGLQGLSALGPTGLEAAKAILGQVCLRYKFGIDIADIIQKIQPPPPPPPEPPKGPPPPSPEEIQATQMEAQGRMQKVQNDTQVLNAKRDFDLAKIAADQQKLALDIQEAQLRLDATRVKLNAQNQMAQAKLDAQKNAPVSNSVSEVSD